MDWRGQRDWQAVVKELEAHPAFIKSAPGEEIGEAMAALQAMKYDEEDPPEERARQVRFHWLCVLRTESSWVGEGRR